MTFTTPELLLVGAVASVGVLHTMVPDHWVPITLIARQRGWTRGQTARAALLAGTGHVLSTLAIAVIVWIAGVAAAKNFGSWIDTLTSLALVGFGSWIAISALLEMRGGAAGHGHSHGHSHSHGAASGEGGVHGPELQEIATPNGQVQLSIYEDGMPPHFRLTGSGFDRPEVETQRPDGATHAFLFEEREGFWQSVEEIPEPHQFKATLRLCTGDRAATHETEFREDDGPGGHHHHHHAALNAKPGSRTALLLILGSSPMVEGIPAFFAAGKYGVGLIMLMSLVFGVTTIVTYVVLCVVSAASLKRVSLGPLEKYGEVLSGAFIAAIGLVFWLLPYVQALRAHR